MSTVSGIIRRYFLKKKETTQLLTDFSRRLKMDVVELLGSKPRIERAETKVAEIFIVNSRPLLARSGGVLFPTLIFKGIFPFLPKLVVDKGAVSHICNGADVMAPGMVRIKGSFDENDLLLIVDEQYEKPLAIGEVLFNLQAVGTLKRGKIAKNIHYVGDKLWGHIKMLT